MAKTNLRILILNDDPGDVKLLRDALINESDLTYQIEVIGTGAAGVAACMVPGPAPFDCVIVDLHLPDMDGLEVLKRLKSGRRGIRLPVVLFIDTGEECAAASAALRAGAEDYIARSWLTADGLACAVENAIKRARLRCRLRRKQVKLKRQHREFQTLLDNIPHIIMRFNNESRLTYVNPAIEEATGIPAAAFTGKTLQEAGLAAEVSTVWEAELDRVKVKGAETRFEFEMPSPAGMRSYEARLVPQRSRDGKIKTLLGVATNITLRKRAEEAHRAGEEHLRNILDRLITFVGVLTPEGVLIEANRPALEATSLQPDDVLGRPFEEAYWWSYSPEIQAELRRAIDCAALGKEVRYDVMIRTGADRFTVIDFRLAPLVDQAGRVTHLIPSGVDITERKKTEQAVAEIATRERERSLELQTLLRAAPAAIFISKDQECRQMTGNPAAYKLLRMDPESNVSASSDFEAFAKRACQEYRDGRPIPPQELPMQMAAAHGIESQGTELTLRFDDGTERIIYGNATPLREPGGKVYGAISAFIDITQLREAEAAVRISEERLRLASEAVSGLIYEWNLETGHVERSAGLLDLTGYRPDEAEPTVEWWYDRIHPEDVPGLVAASPVHGADPCRTQRNEYRIRHRDGSYRHVWDHSRIVYDDQGRPCSGISYTIDITDRVRGEEALRLSERRFRRLTTSDIIGIIVSDTQGGLHDVNGEFLRIIGYTREQYETESPTWTELTPPEWQQADELGIAEALNTGSCEPYEKEYFRRDGSRIPVLIGYTLIDESGLAFLAFVIDQTQQKHSEKALKEADRRKDEFLAMLAHELRNPLAAIRAAVHVLNLKGPDLPELAWGRNVIDRQARHLTRLIEDLLDVSRISTGKIQLKQVHADVNEIATRAAESVWPVMQAKQHQLKIELPEEPLRAHVDPARLEQVLGNLLTNAAKYTDNNGSITLSAFQESSDIVLRVQDNGIGIKPEMLPVVFNLYAQVDGILARSLGGLGIGLTLVKMLVELHGGTVSARSDGPGKGSEFTIRLPSLDAPPEGGGELGLTESKPLSQVSSPGRLRVLLIDDNVDVAVGLTLLIESLGHEVRAVHEAQAGLQTARDFRPAFVLMDIGLPGMNGFDLARAFKNDDQLKAIKLIAISGFVERIDPEKSSEAGFDHYLVKPVDLGVLAPILADEAKILGMKPTQQSKT